MSFSDFLSLVTTRDRGHDLNASRSGKRSGSAVPVIRKKGKGDLRYVFK